MVRDANDQQVGWVVGDGLASSWGMNVAITETAYDGTTRPVVVRVRTSGFGPAVEVFFSEPACTGRPYVKMDVEGIDPLTEAQVVGGIITGNAGPGRLMSGLGTKAYYPSGQSEWTQPASRAEVVEGPNDCFSGSTFMPPSTCCTDLAASSVQLLPARPVSLEFQTPLRVAHE